MAQSKNPWGKLKKGQSSKIKQIAKTGLMGGKTPKIKPCL